MRCLNIGKLYLGLYLVSWLLVISASASAYPLAVTDEAGNHFYLEKPPQRIVSCMPSITEMLFAIGAGDRVVGVTTNCNYPDAAKKLPKVGREIMETDKILSLSPDLVIMQKDAQEQDIQKLRKFKLPVYVIAPRKVLDVLSSMQSMGQVIGIQARSSPVIESLNQSLKKIENRAAVRKKRKNVLVIISADPLMVVGGNNFINDAVKLCGANNLAERSKAPYPIYSNEELLRSKPDALICMKSVVLRPEQIYNNNQVLFIEDDILSRPGPRIIDAMEKISSFLYGEQKDAPKR